jgi:phosphatidylserine/phosphatidylglycerophosphate/cardiolipin synthase-like enzyme
MKTIKQFEKEIEGLLSRRRYKPQMWELMRLKAQLQTLKDVEKLIDERIKQIERAKRSGSCRIQQYYWTINELKELKTKIKGEK